MPDPGVHSSTAKRVYGWTLNLLATALVLLAGGMFGRQVLSWWQTEKPAVQAPQEKQPLLGSPGGIAEGQALHLELGEWPYDLRRVEFSGDRAALRAELRRVCQQTVAETKLSAQTPAGPAEISLLKQLEQETPYSTEPAGYQFYDQDGPLPFVAAVHTENAAEGSAAQGQAVARFARRVVSWGLGVHLAGTRWTLLLLTAGARSPLGDQPWPEIPLPSTAKRVLSLAAADTAAGEMIIAFSGRGKIAEWQQHFDQTFPTVGKPAVTTTWQPLGTAWQKEFETPTTWIDIHLATDSASDEINGFLQARAKPIDGVP